MKKKLIYLILGLVILAVSCDDSPTVPTGPGEFDDDFLNYVAGVTSRGENSDVGYFSSTGRTYTSESGVSYSFVVSKNPTNGIYSRGGFYYIITVGVSTDGYLASLGFTEYNG